MNISEELAEALPYIAFWIAVGSIGCFGAYGIMKTSVASIEAEQNKAYPIINCPENKSPYYKENKYGTVKKEYGCEK